MWNLNVEEDINDVECKYGTILYHGVKFLLQRVPKVSHVKVVKCPDYLKEDELYG